MIFLTKYPLHWLGARGSLAMRLFTSFSIIFILLFSLDIVVRLVLEKTTLAIPDDVKSEMLALQQQANSLLQEGDIMKITHWEKQQSYYLFILDTFNKNISLREMHPHFEFKMRYSRSIHDSLNSRVNKPIIDFALNNSYRLVIQFPEEKHPAHHFSTYTLLSNLVLAILVLSLFSLLLTRYLQKPLLQLQYASHQLAEGDFTVRVKKEVGSSVNEFAELASDFDNMANRIQHLAEKQQRLIRDVSHELRTPLARHDLALHLLRKHVPENELYLLENLQSESDEMNNLVNEILEFSRLDCAAYTAKLTTLQLQPFCQLQLDDIQPLLLPKQTIVGFFNHQTDLVLADSRLLIRVIKNLLLNASKYAGEHATIKVTVKQSDKHYVQVIIEDDGPGIDELQLNEIFTPFTRIEDARDKQSGGYGLGLAIVKESMTVMRGHVQAVSPKQGGLTMILNFPVYIN
ncbi:MAG: HAMP domain-containing protein [Psychromonas sp.]|nr:HAMP domain-containing protein [Alteromonadales bacterium]MCP5078009.1 HAMP domain-containing protein [Psychromonas sp.]